MRAASSPRHPGIIDVLRRMDIMHEQLTDIQQRLAVHDQLHEQITADMRRFGDSLRELHVTVYGNQSVRGLVQDMSSTRDLARSTNHAMTTLAVIIFTPFIAAIVGGIVWAMAQVVK